MLHHQNDPIQDTMLDQLTVRCSKHLRSQRPLLRILIATMRALAIPLSSRNALHIDQAKDYPRIPSQ